MDRSLLAYVLIDLMVALAVTMLLFDVYSRHRKAEHDRRRHENAEYDRIIARSQRRNSAGATEL